MLADLSETKQSSPPEVVIRQPRNSNIRQESINLGMRSAGVAVQIVEGLEILWFAECEFDLPFTNGPNEEALHLMNMMKPVMNA